MDTKILMCAPDYYRCDYTINPWMDSNKGRVNPEKAHNQWKELFYKVSSIAGVWVAAQVEDAPDMVFAANAGLVIGNTAVVATFKYPERQMETLAYERVFKYLGFNTIVPPDSVIFEGAGDCLYDKSRGIHWVGSGFRSTENACMWLHSQFKNEVFIPLKLNTNASFYHLDTCMSILPNGEIVWYPGAFDTRSADIIRSASLPEHNIELTLAEARAFSCNAVCIDDTIIMHQFDAPFACLDGQNVEDVDNSSLIGKLEQLGYTVQTVNLSEFIKTGGSAKCLTLPMKGHM